MGFMFFIWVCFLFLWVIQSIRVMEGKARDNSGYRFLSAGFFILTGLFVLVVYSYVNAGGSLNG